MGLGANRRLLLLIGQGITAFLIEHDTLTLIGSGSNISSRRIALKHTERVVALVRPTRSTVFTLKMMQTDLRARALVGSSDCCPGSSATSLSRAGALAKHVATASA